MLVSWFPDIFIKDPEMLSNHNVKPLLQKETIFTIFTKKQMPQFTAYRHRSEHKIIIQNMDIRSITHKRLL